MFAPHCAIQKDPVKTFAFAYTSICASIRFDNLTANTLNDYGIRAMDVHFFCSGISAGHNIPTFINQCSVCFIVLISMPLSALLYRLRGGARFWLKQRKGTWHRFSDFLLKVLIVPSQQDIIVDSRFFFPFQPGRA